MPRYNQADTHVATYTWSSKPTASEFGMGYAWFSDIEESGYSDGEHWITATQNTKSTTLTKNGVDFTVSRTNSLPRISLSSPHYTGVTMFMDAAGTDGTYAAAQLKSTPIATTIGTRAVGVAGDGIIVAPGTYTANGAGAYGANTYHRPVNLKGLSYIAENPNTVIWKATSATQVSTIDTTLETGMSVYFKNIDFDGNATSATPLTNGTMTAKVWNVTYDSCSIYGGTSRGCLISPFSAGTFNFTGCTFSGNAATAGHIATSGTLAANAAITLNVTDCSFSGVSATTARGIYSITSALCANATTILVDNNTFDLSSTASNQIVQPISLTSPGVTVSNNTITAAAPDNGSTTCYGIWVYSTAFTPVTDASITDNIVNFNCPAGYGIALGTTTTDATTGVIEKNTITGKYYASASPHGIVLQYASTGTARYNKIINTYVCILASKTTTASITENVTVDGYGADLYAKGCTAASLDKNTCIITANAPTRRNLGVLSVDSQSGVNTTATTMSNNVVILGSTSINKLVNISINQSCTFTNNIYIIPDTFADTSALFSVGSDEGGNGGTPTVYTINQWRTGTASLVTAANGTGTIAVSGEKIIKLPLAEILAMIEELNS